MDASPAHTLPLKLATASTFKPSSRAAPYVPFRTW